MMCKELQSTSIFGSYQSTCILWTLNVSFSELASEENKSIDVSIHKVIYGFICLLKETPKFFLAQCRAISILRFVGGWKMQVGRAVGGEVFII